MAAVQPTAPKSYTTVDPYKQYENAYAAQQNAVNAANDAQLLERQNREKHKYHQQNCRCPFFHILITLIK